MNLYPYEFEGVQRLLEARKHRSGLYLADEQGLGKTPQAVELSNLLAPTSFAVICPASLKINWQREFERWGIWGIVPELVNPGKLPKSKFVVLNYDIAHRVDLGFIPDLLICDEAHALKTADSKRSETVRDMCASVLRSKGTVLFLSGTPMPNCPIELWHQLLCLGWVKESDYDYFVKRYCRPRIRKIKVKKNGRTFVKKLIDLKGSSNLDELRTKLREKGIVRRRKEEGLTDLPPKTYQVIELPRRKMWRSNLLNEAMGCSAPHDSRSQVKYFSDLVAVARRTGDLKKLTDSLAEARRLDGIEKVPQVIELVEESLQDPTHKIVLMCYHREVWKALMDGFKDYSPVGICGDTALSARQGAVDKFQSDPQCQVFVGQIYAAGTGITLTAASHVLFCELDWVPGAMEQAADRCHRIGQKDNVLVQYAVFEDSTDQKVADALIRKQKTLSAVFDGEVRSASQDMSSIDPLEVFK